MKQMEEMIRAVKDWVNAKIEVIDPDTILRKTGDASKVTTTFNPNASVDIIPESGEELGASMGKILANLSRLKAVAHSGSYKDLKNRLIYLKKAHWHYGTSSAYTEEILSGNANHSFNNIWLIIGYGGSESTAGVSGATDFARAYLVVEKEKASTASDFKGFSYLLLQIGSVGSTARYTLTATAATGPSDDKITLTIPKGSYAKVAIYELSGFSGDIG